MRDNGNTQQYCISHGILLEVHIHRTIWSDTQLRTMNHFYAFIHGIWCDSIWGDNIKCGTFHTPRIGMQK